MLVDETGWNAKTIANIRKSSIATVGEGELGMEDEDGNETSTEPGLVFPSKLRYAADAVYLGLDDKDKKIFDGRTGMHGSKPIPGKRLADMLNLSQAAVSQRSSAIGREIAGIAGRA